MCLMSDISAHENLLSRRRDTRVAPLAVHRTWRFATRGLESILESIDVLPVPRSEPSVAHAIRLSPAISAPFAAHEDGGARSDNQARKEKRGSHGPH